jgi:hypothetical protein
MPASPWGEGRNACGEWKLATKGLILVACLQFAGLSFYDGLLRMMKQILLLTDVEVFAGACTITFGIWSKQR